MVVSLGAIMSAPTARKAAAVAGVLFALAAQPVVACYFDGVMSVNWAPLHPQSLTVAMKVREAADEGVLDAALLDPKAAGPLGYLRATQRLRQLGMSLAESADAMPPMTVLFVESGLWTRYVNGVPQVHVPGAEAGDIVAVTSEAVVAAMLDGRLSGAEAMRRGLLALDWQAEAVRRASQALGWAFRVQG